MFLDPIGTVSLSLPPAWAFDPLSSSLTDLVFLEWTAPSERQFFIHVRRSDTDASATDDEWEAQVRSLLPAEATRVERRDGPWMVVERPGREGRPGQRWGIVRGPRLDTTLEQVGVPLGGALATPELAEALCTLDVPANRHLSALPKDSEVEAMISAVQQALNVGDRRKAARRLTALRRMTKDIWLHSLNGSQLPEVPAAIANAEAALELARLTGSIVFLREATLTLYRCRATLPAIPAASVSSEMQRVDLQIAQALKMHGEAAGQDAPRNPFSACLMRSRLFLRERQRVLKGNRAEFPDPWAMPGVDDATTAVAYAGRGLIRTISPDAAATFAAEGVTDLAAQIKAENEQLLVMALEHVVALCGVLVAARAQANFDADRTITANWLLAARRLVEISPSPAHEEAVVLALYCHAGALVSLGDEPSFEESGRVLEQAQAKLDQLGDEGELRAQVCLNQGWLRYNKHQLDGSLAIVERAIAAANKSGAERIERAARSLHSAFLVIEGRYEEALKEARRASDSINDVAASTHHLNLANALHYSGHPEAALEEVRAGLAAAVADQPLGSDVLGLLSAAAEFLNTVDVKLSLAATEAAEIVLDVLRMRIGDAADHIAFDDAERHRMTAAALVQRRLDADDVLGALSTADRHRARSLAQVTRSTASKSRPSATVPRPTPPAGDAPLEQLFTYVATVAREAIAREGIPAPLDGRALADVVANAGRTALVFHPSGETLHVFLIRPGDQIIIATATAAASVTEIISLTDALRAQLGIVVSARATRGDIPQQSIEDLAAMLADDDAVEAADAELDRLRRLLHDALFSELLPFPLLLPNEPVVVVPYRELAVIPLPVLMGADGRSITESHPLSVLPSLATLGALARSAPGPPRAVVVGDPAVAPGVGLSPLPGAAAEAERVADMLRDHGLETARLLRDAATEAAFREKARGARVVHLACHATVRQQASASSLFLTPAPPDDGLLLPGEIADLRLNGALVVLAACQSGLGRTTADGVLGLGRAFMQAGARTVVLSLWRVSDPATAYLMEAFYDALRGKAPGTTGRLDVAAAVRYAQLATRDAVSAHPSAWGPWLVIGDGSWQLP